MTRRQKEILAIIAAFIADHGHSPSFDEIAERAKLNSLATVHKHVRNLARKGAITFDHNRSRSIKVTGKCPYCGHATKRRPKVAEPEQRDLGVTQEASQ